ncbi:MAG: hypothetical protein U0325_08630 [Polyangiales bacterium]
MEDRITWTDGARWACDDLSFGALRRQLDGLRDAVMGLDTLLDRWPVRRAPTPIDDFAPTEADRAVFTAAVLRAVDEAAGADREGLGLPSDLALARYRADLGALAALVQTDITW